MVLFYLPILIQPHSFGGNTLRESFSRGDNQEDKKQKPSVTKSSQGRRAGQAGDDITSLQMSAGLMWAWELTSLELASERKRQAQRKETVERQRERFTEELTEVGEGFLEDNELPVSRSEQVESVEPCGWKECQTPSLR